MIVDNSITLWTVNWKCVSQTTKQCNVASTWRTRYDEFTYESKDTKKKLSFRIYDSRSHRWWCIKYAKGTDTEWIHRLLQCIMIWLILVHGSWSGSSQEWFFSRWVSIYAKLTERILSRVLCTSIFLNSSLVSRKSTQKLITICSPFNNTLDNNLLSEYWCARAVLCMKASS